MEFADSLRNNREGILRSIDPQGDLLMYMLSEKLVNYDDREGIKGRDRSRRVMAEMILDLVAEKSVQDDTVEERFLRCLQQSGQQHIAALLDEEGIEDGVKPMAEEHNDVILTHLVHLVRSMDPEGDLLCQLRSRGVLDDREIDRIRNQRSADEMNEVLLTEILPLKSDLAFEGLADALRASDQPHVANLLIPVNSCDEIPMSSAHRQFLSANSPHLTHCMDPRYGMIPLMIEHRVISYRDSERILCYQTSSAMNEFILRLLARKPDSSFQRFISVLEESNQSHVLTNCYGHNIEMELKMTAIDPSRLNEAESAVEKELLSKLNNVDGNSIEEIRRNCIKLKLRCQSKEALERLITRAEEGSLEDVLLEPIRQILDARGIAVASLAVSVDPIELNRCQQCFNQQEMSEDNRRYLTMKQFEAGIVIDDTMLEILRVVQVLRNPEMRQIRSQMTMDQRRERLFDTLKRKPDSLFVDMKALFDFRAKKEPSMPGDLNFDTKEFTYMYKKYNVVQQGTIAVTNIVFDFNIGSYINTATGTDYQGQTLQNYGGISSNLLSLKESGNV